MDGIMNVSIINISDKAPTNAKDMTIYGRALLMASRGFPVV